MLFGHKKEKAKEENKNGNVDELALKFIETLKPEIEETLPSSNQSPQTIEVSNETNAIAQTPNETQTLNVKPQLKEEKVVSNEEPIEETQPIVTKPSLFIHINDYEELQELLKKLDKNLENIRNLLNTYKELHAKEEELLNEWGDIIDNNKEKIARILEILNIESF